MPLIPRETLLRGQLIRATLLRATLLRGALLLEAVLLGPAWVFPAAAQEELILHFFDVGQGDAVLVDASEHGAVLYDGGGSPEGVLEMLEALGVEELSLVIASHPHLDHIGGLPAVLAAYRPPFVLDNGLDHTTRAYERYLEAVAEAGSALLEPEARTIALGEADLHVLPPPGAVEWSLNDNSVGIVVEYGAFRATLGGDAEAAQWTWWAAEEVLPEGPVQVHKASHHGSKNGDTFEGMARIGPGVVVIGAGADNPYGHPHPEALAIYDAIEAKVYRTDLHGTVTVTAARDGTFEIAVEREEVE